MRRAAIIAALALLTWRGVDAQSLGGKNHDTFLIDLSTSLIRSYPYTDPPQAVTGQNESIETTYETVWSAGGIRPLPPPAGLIMSLRSTDADDNSAGTGAQTVLVTCLDPAGSSFGETISMNGVTLVPMVSPCYRIIPTLTAVIDSGASLSNEGTVTFENAGTVYEEIGVEDGQGFGNPHTAAFTIPAGRVGTVGGLSIFADTAVSIQFLVHPPAEAVFFTSIKVDGAFHFPIEPPICLSALTDVEVRAKKPGGGSVPIAVSFKVILVDSLSGRCPVFF